MLKTYKKDSKFSYSFGVFPTIELLNSKRENVIKVLINPKGLKNSGVETILNICDKLNIPIEEDQVLIERLAGNENTYAIGMFEKYDSFLDQKDNHIILVNPSDMGNLGTVCRTMLAFDFKNLVLIKPAVDIFDPKVIRSSMGAVFHLNFEYFESFEKYSERKENLNRNYYPLMVSATNTLDKIVLKKPYSLVFGNEGKGLDEKFYGLGESVSIPQGSEVDSLNLSVAVGIVLYKAFQKFSS
jgi:TrmH family RNA methyltransferase